MKQTEIVGQVVETLLRTGAKKATKFISPKQIVRATRFGRVRRDDTQANIVLTIGQPNFAERLFVKACRKAGEKFPVKKIQLKFTPKKK